MSDPVIYKIRNVTNQKFYVGSTSNKRERFRNHRKLLRASKHHCKHLQAAWNKYGEECFVFEVVETVAEVAGLWAAEDRWLDEHFGKPHCYNAGRSADAPMRGRVGALHPQYGTTQPQERKDAIAASLRAFYAANPDAGPMRGKTHSASTRELLRQAKLANPTRAWLGKQRSEETRAKISATQKGRPSPRKGLPMSEEARVNVAAAVKRGEESHFYGKRPVHADDLQKAVLFIAPDGTRTRHDSQTKLHETVGVSKATVIRACKSGKPIKFGEFAGYMVRYVDEPTPQVTEFPSEYADLPRARTIAKEMGAPLYFTGLPCTRGHLSPRFVKGGCVACSREDEHSKRAQAPDLAYSHERQKAKVVTVKTDAPPMRRSEWPLVLEYGGFRWGRHELTTDVHFLPEDLETALLQMFEAFGAQKPLHPYYWTAAENTFPATVVGHLRIVARRLAMDTHTPTMI